jgi:hypothetical protein
MLSYTIATDGSQQTDLGIDASCAVWFPDGDRILVGQGSQEPGDVRSLWSVNSDGSGAQRLVVGTDVGGWLSLPDGDAGSASP